MIYQIKILIIYSVKTKNKNTRTHTSHTIHSAIDAMIIHVNIILNALPTLILEDNEGICTFFDIVTIRSGKPSALLYP